MKNPLLLLLLIFLQAAHVHSADTLTVERIYSSPSLSGERIRSAKISPNGQKVSFLRSRQEDFEHFDLWELDIESGKSGVLINTDTLHMGDESLSDEEKARRERQRFKGTGIATYEWSFDGKSLLFPLAGDIYHYKLGQQTTKKVVATPEFETDIRFSPKAKYISYIREQNIYIKDLSTGKETALTQDGKGPIKYGMAEFVAQEEMGRMTGYWWSGDESKIAFLKVDESPVEYVSRNEIYAEEVKIIRQRYPFAGKANAHVSLGIVDIKSLTTKWVDLGENQDFYIPRVKWTKDNNLLSYQWQSRDQKTLRLHTVTWPSMKQEILLTEKSQTWVNLHDDLHFTKDKKYFIWSSERDGYRHLYRYSLTGDKQPTQLTKGAWSVDQIEGIDNKDKQVFFTGRKDTPLEKHLYSVPFAGGAGGDIATISQRDGFHRVNFSQNSEYYVDEFSTLNSPPQVSLHNKTGKRMHWLAENRIDKSHPLKPYIPNWISPDLGSLTTKDKSTLYYKLYKPAKFNPKKKYPALVYLYGGPGVQKVTNSWSQRDALFSQYMAQQGYVVFTLDNRGSTHRGKAFEDPIYQAMGDIEIQDQEEGVKYLHQQPWIDQEKIGIHGHSYGGYLTIMALFKSSKLFKAGVAGSPVTDWRLYDTHYTERYMGHPESSSQAYQASSVFPYADNLKNPLLIYHGMADDNVVFKNSTKLYSYLQDNNLPFFAMDYPGKKHSIKGKKTEMHRMNMIRQFFDLHFGIQR